jgi:capsular polysaccharide biosynthesis protein
MKRTICLILGVASLGLGVYLLWGTMVLLVVPRKFESTAKLLMRSALPPNPGWSVESDIERLQSRPMLYQVITNLDLARRWGERYKEGALRMDTTYALLHAHLDIQRLTNSNIVEIHARSDDPNEAAAIANAVAHIAITRLADPVASTSTAKEVVYSLVKTGTATPKPVHPSRLKRTAFPIGGFCSVIGGIVLLLCATMIPKRPSPPPLRS